ALLRGVADNHRLLTVAPERGEQCYCNTEVERFPDREDLALLRGGLRHWIARQEVAILGRVRRPVPALDSQALPFLASAPEGHLGEAQHVAAAVEEEFPDSFRASGRLLIQRHAQGSHDAMDIGHIVDR